MMRFLFKCVYFQMISYNGSDLTTASLSKRTSPLRQDTGKVVKSIFVPNVGWASQVMDEHIKLIFYKQPFIVFVIKCSHLASRVGS